MVRKKHSHIPSQPKAQVDLDSTLGTSDTLSSNTYARQIDSTYNINDSGSKTVDASPPLSGDSSHNIKQDDFKLSWKVTAVVATIFLTLIIPSILFVFGLDKDVENLTVEVTDIKETTDNLHANSIRTDERLKNTEKSINEVMKSVKNHQETNPIIK